MPQLARRRNDDPHREGWNVFFGDVRVGHIGRRAGVPVDADRWGWSCGFYPGTWPGEHLGGTAAVFDQARPLPQGMAGLPGEPDRGRLRGVAAQPSLDGLEVRHA